MRFVIGLDTVVLALAPYWLVAIACKSSWLARMWLLHGTLCSMALAALAVLSRIAMSIPPAMPRDVGTWSDSAASMIMSVDIALMSPLYGFCESVAGRQTSIPTFAMITYGLVIYFAIYRVIGFLLTKNRDAPRNVQAVDVSLQ